MVSHKKLYKLHADFCKFMANPKRIEILFLLGEKEMCIDDIKERINYESWINQVYANRGHVPRDNRFQGDERKETCF